jgi:hypothetical protein
VGARSLTARAACAAVFVAALAALLLAACSGPRVTATGARVAPSPRPGFYRVQAALTNRGGRGQAEVTIRLRNVATGAIVTHTEPVDLRPDDRVDVVTDVAAPPAEYTVAIEVQYPPG